MIFAFALDNLGIQLVIFVALFVYCSDILYRPCMYHKYEYITVIRNHNLIQAMSAQNLL